MLTAKLESSKASGPQGAPELFLLLCLGTAKTSGVAGRSHRPDGNYFRPPNQSPPHEPPIEQGASSPQPSPPQVCGGEGDGRTRRVHGFNARMCSANSLPAQRSEGRYLVLPKEFARKLEAPTIFS